MSVDYDAVTDGNRQRTMLAAYLFCAAVGGSAMFAIRQTIGTQGYPTYAAAALRFTVAFLLYAGLWAAGLGRGKVSATQVLWLTLAGLASSLAHILLYQAAHHLEGGPAAGILALSPFFAGILAWKTKTEVVTWKTLMCAAIAAIGVGILSWVKSEHPAALWSLAAVGVAAVLFAFSNLGLKRQSANLTSKDQKAPVCAQGAIFFCAAALPQWLGYLCAQESLPGWPWPTAPTGWLAYTIVIVSGVSFATYLWLMQSARMMKVMSMAYLQPLVALGIDSVGEPHHLDVHTCLGSTLIAFGVAMDRSSKVTPTKPSCGNGGREDSLDDGHASEPSPSAPETIG
jgi:drug/metabolite transporter (DMT)-like permease